MSVQSPAPMEFPGSRRRRAASFAAFVRRRRRLLGLVGVPLLILLAAPLWAGAALRPLVTGAIAGRLGVPVSLGGSRVGLGRYIASDLVIGGGAAPLARVERVEVPLAAAWGGGTVRVRGARIVAERGGPNDNVSALLERQRRREAAPSKEGGSGSGRALPVVIVEESALELRDARAGRTVLVGAFDAKVAPGRALQVRAQQVSGALRLRGGDRDPTFGATQIDVELPLAGLRPAAYPKVALRGGYVSLLRALGLTGVEGTVAPLDGGRGGDRGALAVALSGSYGGAKETLWTAQGTIAAGARGALEGTLALRAARFSLGKIADVLPPTILEPKLTSINAALDLTFSPGRVGFKGDLDVTGLSLHHEAVAFEPVLGIDTSLKLDGAVDLERRRLELGSFEGRLQDLVARLSGSVELAPGTFKFKDGSEMAMLPKIDLALRVPKISCAKLLGSIPSALIPHLTGFVLQGSFEADVRANIDYTNLDALVLDGKVGIGGCKVLKAPEEVTKLATEEPITQLVEVPTPPGKPPGLELLAFVIGPSNPDFVPYAKISPFLVASVMTTEDNGFFKHRGWISSEFKTALRRNLANGGFRLGASTITMQMTKNVLLAREKTLSRKLQELFLVWYLEQLLPKERILELYFNAIEFGPRLYGIGPAARHYFGKAASEFTPLEAAFISSLLPSPKRRYIQYCHGALYPPWDKYVRRILARMYERGRLGDEEYAEAANEAITFDLTERPAAEKECLEWVKAITQRPAAEAPPEGE